MLKLNSHKLGYKGRMVSLLFVAAIILFIRSTVIHRFGEAPHFFPVPAIIILIIAWQFGKQYDKHTYLATKDPLTGLYNRRFVRDQFPRLTSFSKRRGLKISAIILDVNDFKQINDQYGHDVGDKVLIGISHSLQKCFGKNDIVARMGGDEFLVLAVFSDEKTIDHSIHEFQNRLESDWGRIEKVSVSIGKATFPQDHTDLKELIAIADENMYEVKLHEKI